MRDGGLSPDEPGTELALPVSARRDPRTLFADLKALYRFLPPRRLREFRLVLILSGVAALADVVTIGALLPFLAIVAGEVGEDSHLFVRTAFEWLGGFDASTRFLLAAAALVGAAVVAALLKGLLFAISQRFVFRSCNDIGRQVLANTLAQPYSYHLATSSAELIATIAKVRSITVRTVAPLIQIVSQLVTAAVVFAMLVAIEPVVAAIALGGICAAYLVVAVFATGLLRRNSAVAAGLQSQRMQTLQESLGSIREVLIDRSQDHFVNRFDRLDRAILDARASSLTIGMVPRYVVETGVILVIVGLAYYLASAGPGLGAAIPVLGGMILGIQKLLPAVQTSYSSWAGIRGNHHALLDVIDKLELADARPAAASAPLPFERDIRFEGVTFSYPERAEPALRGIDLSIEKGARIGIAGRSGGGKSTFADLLLGLLLPDEGRVLVDGVPLGQENLAAWHLRVAHVAQHVYLTDRTIRENIAMAEAPDAIDAKRLAAAVAGASLTGLVADLPHGLDTVVGEDGVRLSGGQKQRIGIARALYAEADVLVFDEATSALDSATESEVVEAIRSIDRSVTILVIAHRPSSIEWCDRILVFENGRLKA
jgi:ABC-type multidrug transport system fused ATPase/permease subunit